jgi:hypothetical protein
VSTGEWILIVIGAVQAIALGVAAIFAWLSYQEAGRQRELAEDRRLLQGVVDEVLDLVPLVEMKEIGAVERVEGQLQRLRIALAFAPMRLDQTDLLSRASPGDADGIRRMLEAARVELAEAAEKLSERDSRSKDLERPTPAMLGQKGTHSGQP